MDFRWFLIIKHTCKWNGLMVFGWFSVGTFRRLHVSTGGTWENPGRFQSLQHFSWVTLRKGLRYCCILMAIPSKQAIDTHMLLTTPLKWGKPIYCRVLVGFPKMGVALVFIHFSRIFHQKNRPLAPWLPIEKGIPPTGLSTSLNHDVSHYKQPL